MQYRFTYWLIAATLLLIASGCARPQRTENQVTTSYSPRDLKMGDVGSGGESGWPAGGGAGGSGAAGVETGRIGGPLDRPVSPPAPPGRMAPVGSCGSGDGDSGVPIPPDVDLQSRMPK